MYGMSGFVEKLKLQNFIHSARIVYIIYGRNVKICREIENLERRKFNGKLCAFDVRNGWFCLEIEYPKFHKFSGKLCIFCMYGISRFAEKLNIFKYINLAGNYVHHTYGLSGCADKFKIQNCVNSTENSVH